MDIRGEVVLITGGGSGLGRAIVERFHAEGARIAVLEKSPPKAGALRESHPDIVVVEGDCSRLDPNQRAVDETLARYGRLDVFIGNAGVWDNRTGLLQLEPERIGQAFDEVFSVNVRSLVLGARAAAQALLQSRGSMIFTLSNASFHTGGGGPLYTASKHAAVGLLRQLAYELAPAIRVNGVAPTAMASDLRSPDSLSRQPARDRPVDPASREAEIAAMLPLNFDPVAEDYVGAYLYLASRTAARVCTGSIIACDGGIDIRGIRPASGVAPA